MIKKVVTGVVLAGAVVFAALWAASPVLAGKAIIRAAERGDEAALERHFFAIAVAGEARAA